jgi:CRISPR-associated protein Cmr6
MNLNYLFNKAYYDNLSYKHDDCNKELTERRFIPDDEEIPFIKHSFSLKTLYPGLLIGIGNTHAASKECNNDSTDNGTQIVLGFTLDYVTGLPVIPGSTVKGVLRSAFKNHPEYVASIIGVEANAINCVWKSIFAEGSNKVVFFDAIPVKAGKYNRLLGLENITPHPDPLKNPIPLTLLKVIPNVEFLFRFGFDRWNSKDISLDNLKYAFKMILCDLGSALRQMLGLVQWIAWKKKARNFTFLNPYPIPEIKTQLRDCQIK